MNRQELIADLKSIVTDPGTQIAETFIHGWLSSINEGPDYDVFLLIPPRRTNKTPRGTRWIEYAMTIYLFRQNVVDGRTFTDSERDEAWTEMESTLDVFISKLNESPNKYQITTEVTMEPDEGNIGNDDTVWIKCTFTMNVAYC